MENFQRTSYKKNKYKKTIFKLENALIISILISILINFVSTLTMKVIENKIKIFCIILRIIFILSLFMLFKVIWKISTKTITQLKLTHLAMIIVYSLLTLLTFIMIIITNSNEVDKNLILFFVFSGVLSLIFHFLFLYSIRALLKQLEIKEINEKDFKNYSELEQDLRNVLAKT